MRAPYAHARVTALRYGTEKTDSSHDDQCMKLGREECDGTINRESDTKEKKREPRSTSEKWYVSQRYDSSNSRGRNQRPEREPNDRGCQVDWGGSSLALALIVVVVNTETGRVLWVTTLNITVKSLLQVIEVGLPARGTLEQCTRCRPNFHTIVPTESCEHITTVLIKKATEVAGTFTDVEARISASFGRTAFTLVLGNLHQTLFSCTADLVRLASALLHGDSSKENGRNIVLVAILVKVLDEGTAGGEWVVVLFENLAQILIDEVVNRNMSEIGRAHV